MSLDLSCSGILYNCAEAKNLEIYCSHCSHSVTEAHIIKNTSKAAAGHGEEGKESGKVQRSWLVGPRVTIVDHAHVSFVPPNWMPRTVLKGDQMASTWCKIHQNADGLWRFIIIFIVISWLWSRPPQPKSPQRSWPRREATRRSSATSGTAGQVQCMLYILIIIFYLWNIYVELTMQHKQCILGPGSSWYWTCFTSQFRSRRSWVDLPMLSCRSPTILRWEEYVYIFCFPPVGWTKKTVSKIIRLTFFAEFLSTSFLLSQESDQHILCFICFSPTATLCYEYPVADTWWLCGRLLPRYWSQVPEGSGVEGLGGAEGSGADT